MLRTKVLLNCDSRVSQQSHPTCVVLAGARTSRRSSFLDVYSTSHSFIHCKQAVPRSREVPKVGGLLALRACVDALSIDCRDRRGTRNVSFLHQCVGCFCARHKRDILPLYLLDCKSSGDEYWKHQHPFLVQPQSIIQCVQLDYCSLLHSHASFELRNPACAKDLAGGISQTVVRAR